MHLELDARVAIRVEQLERAPVQVEQSTHARVEARGRGAAPEPPQPAHERRVERGAENERIAARHELAYALTNHPRRGKWRCHARNDPARVAARDAAADLAALEQGHLCTVSSELPRTGEPDDPTTDDDD